MEYSQRFVALDVHKHYVLVAAIDATQKVVLSPRKISMERFEGWAQEQLLPTDAVVLEATTNAWTLYDLRAPLVAQVKVAHPFLVKLIASARVKTDTRDTLHLARLLLAGLIPAVRVPPQPVRELRLLMAHRQRLIRQRTQARNRMQSLLHAHNIVPPTGKPFAALHQPWWEQVDLPMAEKLRLLQDLAIMGNMDQLLGEVDAELQRLSLQEPWASSISYLIQLPGLAVINSMTLLAAIGDITRFPSAKHLVGYSGLGASVHPSGQTYQTGRIIKQGRREMRSALIEAAWMAVEYHPYEKTQFERLAARIGKGKAIVGIARKLLVVIWHVLTEQVADRHAETSAVARKFLRWGKTVGQAHRQGLTIAAFARHHLDQVRVGHDLEAVEMGGKVFKLLPVSSNSA
jgi:transposase